MDLDNFKAYNDVYGFLEGDQIIVFTAENKLIKKDDANVEESAFVGHIGGDDFVAIVPTTNSKEISQEYT